MRQPKPDSKGYAELIVSIDKGEVKIPQFQRDFVWSLEKVTNLMDSILKGYPIGSFILWETNCRLHSIRDIGGLTLPEPPDGRFVQYVLDGQQRMTSIYVAVKGAKVGDTDYSKIYVDLTANNDERVAITDITGKKTSDIVSLKDIIEGDIDVVVSHSQYKDKMKEYRDAFLGLQLSCITVKEVPIDVATEIFTRINEGGKPLSSFEIMVAKTYDEGKQFDLSVKYDELMNELENVGYETVSSSTVLQSVAVCLTGECNKKVILRLDKDAFIDSWDSVVSAFKEAIDYLRSSFGVSASRILPYDALLVPLTYWFYKYKEKPVGERQRYMVDYFWRVVLTERFSSSLEAKIAQDIKRMDVIAQNERPAYDVPVDISVKVLRAKGGFTVSNAWIKGMLCLLASQKPLSLDDNSSVLLGNDYLKQSNSKNYHHFFPKAYLKKRGVDASRINHIANITLVTDKINKGVIKDKAPSVYIANFRRNNPNIDAALETHLIGDEKKFGIRNDNYDAFFRERLKRFNEELRKRIVKTPLDKGF